VDEPGEYAPHAVLNSAPTGLLGFTDATPFGPTSCSSFRLDTVAAMADLVETHDLTAPSQDGWAVDYRIRREDGEELHAEVRCWEKAHAAAEQERTPRLSRRSRIVASLLRSSTPSKWSRRRGVARC
jgi:hypothetical protein